MLSAFVRRCLRSSPISTIAYAAFRRRLAYGVSVSLPGGENRRRADCRCELRQHVAGHSLKRVPGEGVDHILGRCRLSPHGIPSDVDSYVAHPVDHGRSTGGNRLATRLAVPSRRSTNEAVTFGPSPSATLTRTADESGIHTRRCTRPPIGMPRSRRVSRSRIVNCSSSP